MKEHRIEAPLPKDLIEELINFWQAVFESSYERFRGMLAAEECAENRNIIYLIRKGKKLGGTCHLTVSKSNPELGALGEVATAPELRRVGIASTLCERARDDFRTYGGQALLLGTINPAAARVYSRLGWCKLDGTNVMALITSGDSPETFLADYFRERDSARIATATAAVRVPMIPLLISPHEWQVLDANVGMFSTRYVVQNSCVGLYPRYKAVIREGRSAWFGARTGRGRLVGLSTVCLGKPGQCQVDGFTHQNYPGAWEDLVQAAMRWGVAHGAAFCWATVSAQDENKRSLFESLGFRKAGKGDKFNLDGLDGRRVASLRLKKSAAGES